jgi:hypothetical protein
MGLTVPAAFPQQHHPKISPVERATFADDFRQRLLALRSQCPRVQQVQKDLQQGKNKAPETITLLIADAFNSEKQIDDVVSPAQMLVDYCKARVRRVRRAWHSVSPLETKEEGDLNCVQNAIDLGDHSTPTLTRFVKEAGEYIAVIEEMREAALTELYAPAAS